MQVEQLEVNTTCNEREKFMKGNGQFLGMGDRVDSGYHREYWRTQRGSGGWVARGQTYSEHAVYKSCEAMTQASH